VALPWQLMRPETWLALAQLALLSAFAKMQRTGTRVKKIAVKKCHTH